jgi:hypothetical protein
MYSMRETSPTMWQAYLGKPLASDAVDEIGAVEHFGQIEDAIDALVGLLIGYPSRQPWGAWESNQWESLMDIGRQVRAAKACYRARNQNRGEA